MQVKGVNYLIPVRHGIQEESEVEFYAVDAGMILAKMESAGNPLNIVILDACRDNPFKRSFRSSSKGLAKMDAPDGTIIAYATKSGSVAADGKGRNGTYTAALLNNLENSDLDVRDMFNKVGLEVKEKTKGGQIPWTSNDPFPDYFLAQGTTTVIMPSVTVKNKGKLNITSDPKEADIFLNSQFKGKSPLDIRSIDPGTYSVKAQLKGYNIVDKTVRVNTGRKAVVTFYLDKIRTKTKLYVNTDPKDSLVRILNIKEKYRSGIELDSGQYRVEVSKSGYKTNIQWVSVEGSDGVDLYIDLEKQASQLSTMVSENQYSGNNTWKSETNRLNIAFWNFNYKNGAAGVSSYASKKIKESLESKVSVSPLKNIVLKYDIITDDEMSIRADSGNIDWELVQSKSCNALLTGEIESLRIDNSKQSQWKTRIHKEKRVIDNKLYLTQVMKLAMLKNATMNKLTKINFDGQRIPRKKYKDEIKKIETTLPGISPKVEAEVEEKISYQVEKYTMTAAIRMNVGILYQNGSAVWPTMVYQDEFQIQDFVIAPDLQSKIAEERAGDPLALPSKYEFTQMALDHIIETKIIPDLKSKLENYDMRLYESGNRQRFPGMTPKNLSKN